MLAEINEEIRKSLAQNRRNSDECQLIAVSKKQSLDAILKVFHEGQTAFGENYVQEGVEKIQQLSKDIRAQSVWHMIGPLQSNKAKLVAQHFDWVQTITSLKTAQKLRLCHNLYWHSGQFKIKNKTKVDYSSSKNIFI